MKVQFKMDFKGNVTGADSGKREWEEGDIDEVPDELGERWSARGYCKPYYPVKEKKVVRPSEHKSVESEYKVEKRSFGHVYVVAPDGSEEHVGQGNDIYEQYKDKYGA